MIKTKLIDGQPTLAQQAVIGFWLVNLGLTLALWATTAIYGSLADWLDAFGMLFGLLAVYFALTQFMLMGRIAWVERTFGLDHLASWHRINGYLAISFILVHPVFITFSYAARAHVGPIHEYFDLITHYAYVWLALLGELLFIAVVASSIYIVRKKLKFESWYFVHLMVYLAIVSVAIHPFFISDSFADHEHPLARAYWLGLYAFVALNLFIWRLGQPLFNFWRFGWRVERAIAETPTATSIYIQGRNLARWRTRPGQFVLVRFFAKGFWGQEHPFSLSMVPSDNHLRLTIRHVGDYTSAVANLKVGTRVLVSGPYGRFTDELAKTRRRLFIAGGVGITPIHPLVEQALNNGHDSVLLYANRAPNDVVLASELTKISSRLRIINIFSQPPKSWRGETGYVDGTLIRRLVPDYKKRDIYLCGPLPMMEAIISDLKTSGFNQDQLHYERFALHN